MQRVISGVIESAKSITSSLSNNSTTNTGKNQIKGKEVIDERWYFVYFALTPVTRLARAINTLVVPHQWVSCVLTGTGVSRLQMRLFKDVPRERAFFCALELEEIFDNLRRRMCVGSLSISRYALKYKAWSFWWYLRNGSSHRWGNLMRNCKATVDCPQRQSLRRSTLHTKNALSAMQS